MTEAEADLHDATEVNRSTTTTVSRQGVGHAHDSAEVSGSTKVTENGVDHEQSWYGRSKQSDVTCKMTQRCMCDILNDSIATSPVDCPDCGFNFNCSYADNKFACDYVNGTCGDAIACTPDQADVFSIAICKEDRDNDEVAVQMWKVSMAVGGTALCDTVICRSLQKKATAPSPQRKTTAPPKPIQSRSQEGACLLLLGI